jgi:parallel beta-helix repeat protein
VEFQAHSYGCAAHNDILHRIDKHVYTFVDFVHKGLEERPNCRIRCPPDQELRMKILTLVLSLILVLAATALGETYRYTPGQAHLLPDAFERLESGDRVVLERGTYRLEFGLELTNLSNITIEGQGRVTLLVDNLDDPVIDIDSCTDVTVKGLRAAHKEPAQEYQCEGAVIEVRSSKRVFIAKNRLNGCGAAGVYATSSKDVVVYQNRIFNNTYAAIWVAGSQVAVHDNWIYDNRAALNTYGECDITFTKNRIKNNDGNIYMRTGFFKKVVGD